MSKSFSVFSRKCLVTPQIYLPTLPWCPPGVGPPPSWPRTLHASTLPQQHCTAAALSRGGTCRQSIDREDLQTRKNHISFWHLSKLWTGKSDKSSKIINPQSVRLSSNSMLNLTKGRRSVWALQPSAKGVTGVVSHYSSYPASFREFLAPDAPEHSLLVNTSRSVIPTCTLGHTWAHEHTHPRTFLISHWCIGDTS